MATIFMGSARSRTDGATEACFPAGATARGTNRVLGGPERRSLVLAGGAGALTSAHRRLRSDGGGFCGEGEAKEQERRRRTAVRGA